MKKHKRTTTATTTTFSHHQLFRLLLRLHLVPFQVGQLRLQARHLGLLVLLNLAELLKRLDVPEVVVVAVVVVVEIVEVQLKVSSANSKAASFTSQNVHIFKISLRTTTVSK